ncbi:peptide deformylase-like protein [Devosia pacifica]|uniref:Peptide deformylase-like n=1 Tax=Devosia pacifica TaxID=1335967 RepID=A0A918RRY6_9HYPH|nr:peptide deformylase [Devosia pacifica]GHA10763.1 peptide deformylase-like protein [Devosia pacifica]
MAGFIAYPDPIFRQKAVPRPPDESLRQVGQRLLAAASEVKAYGLAAAHIGVCEPVIVMTFSSDPEKRDYQILYNPRVTMVSGEAVAAPEGSVSLPGLEAEINRHPVAEVEYDDETGGRHTDTLQDFVARVAQHEIDQVNGIFFLDKLSRLKRDRLLKRHGIRR